MSSNRSRGDTSLDGVDLRRMAIGVEQHHGNAPLAPGPPFADLDEQPVGLLVHDDAVAGFVPRDAPLDPVVLALRHGIGMWQRPHS